MSHGKLPILPGVRATRAIIDLDAISGNVQAVRGILRTGTRIMAVVKANAYGHGAPLVAATALEAGAGLLGVATVGEGKALRNAGTAAQIVLLGAIEPSEAEEAVRLGLDITVAEPTLLEAVQRAARGSPSRAPARVHLKVDTGLHRYGADLEQVPSLAESLVTDPHLSFAGVCTHFASADEPLETFTADQLGLFHATIDLLRQHGLPIPERHVANSAGILTGFGRDLEIVRLGIALYGVPPSTEVPLLPGMRAAMRIESQIARVFRLEDGDTVGYNRTFRSDQPLKAALVPIGYADGYRRAFSNAAWIGMKNRRARVLGRVSMDQIVVEVPADLDVKVGDPVDILLATRECGGPTIDDLAQLAGTNSYEILVGIRDRVPRVYMRGGENVAVSGGGID